VNTISPRSLLLAAFLAAPALCAAQGTSVQGAAGTQPMDLRVGRAADTAAAEAAAEAPARAQSAVPGLAAPLVSLGKDYRVVPNDLMDVEIFELDNLKRTVRVSAAGTISLPLIGQVPVAGLTSQEVEAQIADRYREKYIQNPQVSVFIKEFTTERITVEGAVAKPGIFPLAGQMTLLRALAMAGGFGPIANSTQVMLFRTNEQRVREVQVYDVEKIRAGKSEDPVIRGDDLIVVQQDGTRKFLKDSVFRDIIDSINPFSVLR
jgi:polysaccharide export outer membrane protein